MRSARTPLSISVSISDIFLSDMSYIYLLISVILVSDYWEGETETHMLEFLSQNTKEPFFMFIPTIGAHPAYRGSGDPENTDRSGACFQPGDPGYYSMLETTIVTCRATGMCCYLLWVTCCYLVVGPDPGPGTTIVRRPSMTGAKSETKRLYVRPSMRATTPTLCTDAKMELYTIMT